MKQYNPKLNTAKSGFSYITNDMQNTGLVKTAKILAKVLQMANGGGGGIIEEAGGTSSGFTSSGI